MMPKIVSLLLLLTFTSNPAANKSSAPTLCDLADGGKGFCVHSYLCEDQHINDDGAGLISERRYQCKAPKVCCKPKTDFKPTPTPQTDLRRDRAVETSTKDPKKGSTLIPNTDTGTLKRTHCKFDDGKKGYCVQSYLCKDRKIVDDGDGLISERTIQCPAPEVCCELDHESLIDSTIKPHTLVPPKENKPGTVCDAYDGSQGRCVLVHLCNNDTTIIDGGGLISERRLDPCGLWRGGVQICCPAKLLEGKIIPGPNETTTEKISRTNDGDDETCTASDSSAGICVSSYQCDEEFDGSGVINARYQGSCPQRTVCCKKDNVDLTKKPPIPPIKKACGIANKDGLWPNAKTNALEAKFGEFPWMVAVRTKTAILPETYNITGGSLIHPSAVLTVAHYVVRAVDEDVRIRAGEWNTLDVDEPLPHQEVIVRAIVPHPDYNKRNYQNDIAVLFLVEPIKLLPHIGLVCLPPQGALVAPSTDCIANGWGKDKYGKKGVLSNILKKLTLPAVGHEDCQTSLRTTRLGSFFRLHSGFMCAGGGSQDTCTLDGGSPLVCPAETDENRYIQHGVVSWGVDCDLPGIPGVYMDVGQYRTWIDQLVRDEGFDPAVYTI